MREQIKKIIVEDSSISVIKVLTTIATAVSVSLISTKLTGAFNALLVVAVMSIISAVASEFYRVVLAVTSEGAKQALKIKRQNTDNNLKLSENEDNSNRDTANEDFEETVTVAQSDRQLIKEWLQGNKFLRFILLFALVAVTTLGVNYLTSKYIFVETPQSTTIVNQVVQKEIKEEEKQEITENATSTANEVAETTARETASVVAEDLTKNHIAEAKSENEKHLDKIKGLESRLLEIERSEELEKENPRVAELEGLLDAQSKTIRALEDKVKTLEREIGRIQTALEQDIASRPDTVAPQTN